MIKTSFTIIMAFLTFLQKHHPDIPDMSEIISAIGDIKSAQDGNNLMQMSALRKLQDSLLSFVHGYK